MKEKGQRISKYGTLIIRVSAGTDQRDLFLRTQKNELVVIFLFFFVLSFFLSFFFFLVVVELID